MKYLLLSIFTLTIGYAYAQNSSTHFKQAEAAFAKGDYYAAAQLYSFYLKGDSSKTAGYHPYFISKTSKQKLKDNAVSAKAMYQLAESYRLYHDLPSAAPWYKKVNDKHNTQFPLSGYWLGVTLRASEKYDAAENALNLFLKSYPNKDVYASAAQKELNNLAFIKSELAKASNKKLQVKKFEGPANIKMPKSGATVYNSNTIVFTASAIDSTALKQKTDPYKNRLFSTQVNNGAWVAAEQLNIPTTSSVEQGSATFSADGNTIYFTQWEKKSKDAKSQIYVSTKNGNSWSTPELVKGILADGYNTMQPFLTTDGKYLLFASDRPGGIGKYDIWYAVAGSNPQSFSSPINAGKQINTDADEQSPYYATAGKKLVFASNGRVGMGGFDLYSANGNLNSLTQAKNLGYPVNSVRDDVYFYATDDSKPLGYAYFSSDRNSDCCLELYTAKWTAPNRVLSGFVEDCNTKAPIESGKIYLTDEHDVIIDSFEIRNGNYEIVIGEKTDFSLIAKAPKYIHTSTRVDVSKLLNGDEDAEKLNGKIICLVPEEEAIIRFIEKEQLLYFDFDKSDLRPESITSLDYVVDFLNRHEGTSIDIGGYTDEKGSDAYNLALAMKRSKIAAEYMISKGIAKERINLKSYGKCCPVAQEKLADGSDNPEGRQLNRRVGFTIRNKK